ncbi:acetoin reductase family protein [Mycena epipterygia]|nr:acetoin reductase family protein [Mycena epipterygia]
MQVILPSHPSPDSRHSPMSSGTALITGAAQGIGKAIALRLADDGFDVAVNDIPGNAEKLSVVVEEIKAKGRESSAHLADVSVEGEVKAMVEEVVRVHGGLDVMVANAGLCKWSKISDLSVDEWDRLMAVNCRGTFLSYKYAGMQMVSQGRGGRIIGACSVAGKRAGSAFTGAYTASKFAVRGLTQGAALEFGPHGITVNAYAPGAIDTDMLHYMDTSHAKSTGNASGTFIQSAADRVPIQKIGTPTDIASLVSFIASKESQFITGQSLSVNGGMFFD